MWQRAYKKSYKICLLLLSLAGLLPAPSQALPEAIYLAPSTSDYVIDVLSLILNTQKTGIQLKMIAPGPSDERSLEMLDEGKKVDLLWATQRPHQYQNVEFTPLPILKDLHKYRLLLTHQSLLGRFSSAQSVTDLAKLRAGLGPNWPEKALLQKRQFNLVTSPLYDQLFPMLRQKRFDYIPRWSTQIFMEIAKPNQQDFAVVPNIALFHESEFGFYSNKEKSSLAQAIIDGFYRIQREKLFENFFQNHPDTQKAYQFLNGENKPRLIIPF